MHRYHLPIRLVDPVNTTDVTQAARRQPGKSIVTGTLSISPTKLSLSLPKTTNESVQRTVELFNKGANRLLKAHKAHYVIKTILKEAKAAASKIAVEYLEDNDLMADLLLKSEGAKQTTLQLDTSWVRTDQEDAAELLAGMVMFGTLSFMGKSTRQRLAVHRVFNLFGLQKSLQRERIQELLHGDVVDAGNVFRNAFDAIYDANLAMEMQNLQVEVLADAPTEALFNAGHKIAQLRYKESGKSLAEAVNETLRKGLGKHSLDKQQPGEKHEAYCDRILRQLESVLKWRDTWVSWIMAQDRVDIPYPQDHVIDLLNEEFDDIDEKRATINEIVSRGFNYKTEGDNISRIFKWTNESDMRLVAGRLSRAFGNQAQLLSTAKFVEKESLVPIAEKLEKATRDFPDLHLAAARILHLVEERKRTSFARIVGALNAFEETLIKHQSDAAKGILYDADNASRRLLARAAVELSRDRIAEKAQLADGLYSLTNKFRKQLDQCAKKAAAYVVQLQRLHPGEAINLANANAFREVHTGKEEDLKDLIRQGGHYMYSAPGPARIVEEGNSDDSHWIIKVNDWIEAIPLFIHERVISREVKVGNETVNVETIQTEVDQDAMETFFRIHAEFWARNIDEVMELERVALARMLLVESEAALTKKADALIVENPALSRDEAARQVLNESGKYSEAIAQFTALIEESENEELDSIHRMVEKDAVPRRIALRRVLCETNLDSKKNLAGMALKEASGKTKLAAAVQKVFESKKKKLQSAFAKYERLAGLRTRPVSSLHILTTESAGMTEGYVQSWLEEEMALFNIIRDKGLEKEVVEEVKSYRKRILEVGRKVIEEFGMSVVVEEVMAEQRLSEEMAVFTVIYSYKPVAEQVARLAVLLEATDADATTSEDGKLEDIAEVNKYFDDNKEALQTWAMPQVAENNGRAFEQRVSEIQESDSSLSGDALIKAAIESEADYADELQSLMRMEARRIVLDQMSEQHPELNLKARVGSYLRTNTQMARSTARKRVIARHNLQPLTTHPRYYYQASGGNKRYNLLYTPSRVNLGHRERDSVVKWRQWVGGADASAAQAGFEFYSLVNEGGVEERPALAYAEIQKTSENGLCVTHFAGSNALGLLCMAVLEGDVQDMADQMNLREDRLVPPAGEGYGGYCVPKDGLFLAFVLSLTNDVKLRQMGIPEQFHTGIMQLAKKALLQKGYFETELDWQRWAAEKLLKYDILKEHFELRDDLLVFHITKIARSLENLGRPWCETAAGSRLIANLAADWGVEKMIINAEQVNRFMVFYKAWSIYDALAEARSKNPNCPRDHEARIAVSAEYKPVQDVRFSTGLRLFEIFAKTGDHLHYALDEEGQNLVSLMFEGFNPDSDNPVAKRAAREVLQTLNVAEDDKETIARLREAFPAHRPPAELVVTSVTLSSTNDMLFYTSDAKLDEIANVVQVQLADYGLTEDQIRANAEVFGGNLRKWAGISHLPENEIETLLKRVGGSVHALALKLRGPGRDYEKDVQGIDVLNTGIPFRELLSLLQDMPKLVALMLQGNPNSALVIADGCAGREPRALTDYDIKAFFATCEKFNRKGTYFGIGLGRRNVERLENEMQIQRARGQRLLDAVLAVADASGKEQKAAIDQALSVYDEIQQQITNDDEAGKALRQEEKLRRYGKWRKRDAYISQAYAKIAAGLPLGKLDTATWIAVGGSLTLMGDRKSVIEDILNRFEDGIVKISKVKRAAAATRAVPFKKADIEAINAAMLRPAYEPDSSRFTQQKLIESSSKAVEVAAVEALERRRALRVRAEKAKAMSDREDGFKEFFEEKVKQDYEFYARDARELMDGILASVDSFNPKSSDAAAKRTEIYKAFGCLIARTRNAFTALARKLIPGNSNEERARRRKLEEEIALVYSGREIILENLKALIGGYEDIGQMARLAELAGDDQAKLEQVEQAMELFHVTFALGQTLQFAVDDPDEIDPRVFYKNLTDFFAETINDHWYNYTPWCFDRGTGFHNRSEEDIYALSVKYHTWLYRYIRLVIVRCTDLRHLDEADVDALLGKLDGDSVEPGIGAGADSEIELQWRAYNQLREISFVHSDGFATPVVFREFDPALVEADKRINVTFLYPVGRTHVSRALREGPRLDALLKEQGHRGANLLITRHGEVKSMGGAKQKVLTVSDAHLYVNRETYIQALQNHKGMSAAEAEADAKAMEEKGALTEKGIRVAVRFIKDGKPADVVVGSMIPFHGLPMYESGLTEEIGMPATVQSMIFSDITYDKSLYPEIYIQSSGVNLPPEMDWKQDYNEGKDVPTIKKYMTDGYPGNGFVGMNQFSQEHPIVLIKGAAESGARNLKVFEVQDEAGRVDAERVQEAVEFLYDVSRRQSVVVQAAILTSPEFWASPDLMESFVERQILEWNTPVTRDKLPRSQIYGSLRIIATSPHPDQEYDTAFPIILSSLQVATNVGRGGTLEKLLDNFVQEVYRNQIRPGLQEQAPKVMKAMAKYAKKYEKIFKEDRGREAGEDARGVSYAWPPYLMLDYLVTPVFSRPGRLVDIKPLYDESGRRIGSCPVLQDEEGRFDAEIKSWKFIHLEPNVGIGLWDRFNLREEVLEEAASKREGRNFNWDNVGTSDRIVLRNFVIAGEQYIDRVLA